IFRRSFFFQAEDGIRDFHVTGVQTCALPICPLRRRIQIVFQDPFGSLSPRMSIAQIIAEGLEIHKIGTPAEREQMVIDVLREVRSEERRGGKEWRCRGWGWGHSRERRARRRV